MADDPRIGLMRARVAHVARQEGINWQQADAPIDLLANSVAAALSKVQSRQVTNSVYIPGGVETLVYDSVPSHILLVDQLAASPTPVVTAYGSTLVAGSDFIAARGSDDRTNAVSRLLRRVAGNAAYWDYGHAGLDYAQQITVSAVRQVIGVMPAEVERAWEALSVRYLRRSLAQYSPEVGTGDYGSSATIPTSDDDIIRPLYAWQRPTPRQGTWTGAW